MSRVPASDPGFINPVHTELHSHLLPGIDDGVESWEESLEILRTLHEWGYRKVITTPHIMGDFYRNTPQTILPLLEEARRKLSEAGIPIQLEAAAEYMIDELFPEKMKRGELLTFGGRHILVELPFMQEPENFRQVIFDLQIEGYTVVLAHPERYPYFTEQFDRIIDLHHGGVILQINVMSLTGHYTPEVKKAAERIIRERLVGMVGSDIHGPRHLETFKAGLHTKAYQLATQQGLINNSL